MTRVACVGECMIELAQAGGGLLARGWGGDTLNTAVYLARLGVAVDYVTALGDDPLSDEMIEAWLAEGVGTGLVMRVPGRLPGLYLISTDAAGQRRFDYWRDSAPARLLFDLPQTQEVVAALAGYDVIYLSGISLSLYGEGGRARLFGALDAARVRGRRIAFDTNFRARGWPDRALAKAAFRAALGRADMVFASVEDLDLLFGEGGVAELPTAEPRAEVVLKLAEPAVRIFRGGEVETVAAPPVAGVIDTTAAGDSFASAYLAARLAGGEPAAAARCGHSLAGAVVRHRGAIIPRVAMPDECRLVATRGGCAMIDASGARRKALEDILRAAPLVPVITIERTEDGVPLARALVAGGLRALEITLRTLAAPAAARAIADAVPEAIVGIGTVMSPQDLKTARGLGARFAVSPGAMPELLDAAAGSDLPLVPGVQTPSEVMAALARGFDVVKFFPAIAAGGIAALKALAGPFPQVRFCPTGGIGAENFLEWLKLPNVASVGGSWLAPAADIRAADWPAITARARRAVEEVRQVGR
ncbi:MAG TPA: bifunctional 4-hydroxy-2-oxoglutarate aldolase/2-dehydro-3-deoxy-phosphogluconate aldolase [Hyphomicrobiaceae bacterium]|jgi:2-dehydro-3-deoxygluconokinase|nr:bifunctional 4-hydroxy-2-oxoglutarate aldolase/2-dehydro-3-deoxy-phosphogluconate aldolase [Hyphomicrobiaceae bacterium]